LQPAEPEAAMDCYSSRVDLALALAADAFRNRRRKATNIPYLSHLLAVMVTVAEHGGDEDQLIAAVLHDYLEDIEGSSRDQLERDFGKRVGELVAGLSDTDLRPKPPWKERKVAYIHHLAQASPDLKLISAADKLHNARCIERDLRHVGAAVWDRFSAPRDATLWYYRAVVVALSEDWAHPLLDELRATVVSIHRDAGVAWPDHEPDLR
jgi:(p)ppGpp synthase/HD superfamily hydrolase